MRSCQDRQQRTTYTRTEFHVEVYHLTKFHHQLYVYLGGDRDETSRVNINIGSIDYVLDK